ncbi:MAG: hypothetical protein ACRC8S_05415 [Fimbriiglobus sp.]
MPNFLADPSVVFYLLFVVGVLIAGAVWFRNRSKRSLAVFGVALLLLIGLFLLDRAFESPREEATRKIQEMATAANARQWKQVSSHISDKFVYAGKKKAPFEAFIADVANRFNAKVNFKSFSRDDFEVLPEGQIRIGFVAQVESPGTPGGVLYVRAFFTKDPDGQWRMLGFQVKNYVEREGPEVILPGQ